MAEDSRTTYTSGVNDPASLARKAARDRVRAEFDAIKGKITRGEFVRVGKDRLYWVVYRPYAGFWRVEETEPFVADGCCATEEEARAVLKSYEDEFTDLHIDWNYRIVTRPRHHDGSGMTRAFDRHRHGRKPKL